MKQREAVVAEALSWLGTPYHHAARVKGSGVDCGQFVAAVFEACFLIPPEPIAEYPHDWHLHREEERYLGIVERFARKVDRHPLPGDVALFQYGRCISHGAIVVEWPEVVHAYIGRGVVLDSVQANVELADRWCGVWSVWGSA